MSSDKTGSSEDRPVVIAYTTEDDQHPAVRLAAVKHAREHPCALILYAADAASAWSEPLPNQWGSEGEAELVGDRLSPADLEFVGRSAIATQVREAQAGGLQAFGWLPKDHGPRALAEYAIAQGAHRVFVPRELESIDELSSLLAGAPNAIQELAQPGIQVQLVPTDSGT